MPPTIRYQLVGGGPCDGQTVDRSPVFQNGGIIVCGGGSYQADGMTANPVVARYIAPPATAADQLAQYFPSTLRAWDDLRRSINRRLPAAIRAANEANRAATKLLGTLAKRG